MELRESLEELLLPNLKTETHDPKKLKERWNEEICGMGSKREEILRGRGYVAWVWGENIRGIGLKKGGREGLCTMGLKKRKIYGSLCLILKL